MFDLAICFGHRQLLLRCVLECWILMQYGTRGASSSDGQGYSRIVNHARKCYKRDCSNITNPLISPPTAYYQRCDNRAMVGFSFIYLVPRSNGVSSVAALRIRAFLLTGPTRKSTNSRLLEQVLLQVCILYTPRVYSYI